MNIAGNFDNKLREGVVPHAQNFDPAFNVSKATPPTAQPVLDKKVSVESKAENVGFEEFNEEVHSKERDLKAILKGLFIPFFGGSEKREGPEGRIWNKAEKIKLERSTKLEDKNDPDQELE